jgi:8-oxo-dGTP diphosphatase
MNNMDRNLSNIRVNANAAIIRGEEILVIEFKDENGTHYNLPGGGVHIGESLESAVRRECLEEACANVTVGRLLLVWEYIPSFHDYKYGLKQKLGHIFECHLRTGSEPRMLPKPDPSQTNVKWISVSEIKRSPLPKRHPLFPMIADELIEALQKKSSPIRIVDRP